MSKPNKFQNFILSLQEEVSFGKLKLKKKHIFSFILMILFYFVIVILSNILNPVSKQSAEESERIYQELLAKKREEINKKNEPFVEKDLNNPKNQNYESIVDEILKMSDEDIKKMLKMQNMTVNDETIAEFRREVQKNLKDSAKLLEENAKMLKENGNILPNVPKEMQIPNDTTKNETNSEENKK